MVAVESVQKEGMQKAEEWSKSFVRRSRRKNPTIFANISLFAMRVKPHLHQLWGDIIITADFKSLVVDVEKLIQEMANKLLTDDEFFLKPNGRNACLDALSKLFVSVGASSRVTLPVGPTGERVVLATLGHFAFVVTEVRNVLEIAAGIRPLTRGRAIGDGHLPVWVAEVQRLLP